MMEKVFEKADSVLLRNFLTNHKDPTIDFFLEENASELFEGFLVLREKKKPVFVSCPLNYAQAKKVFGKKAVVKSYKTEKGLEKNLGKLLGKRVGFNATNYSVSGLRGLKKMFSKKKFVNVSKELEIVREIKTVSQQRSLKKSCEISTKVLKKIPKTFRKGITELEVMMELEKAIVAFGALPTIHPIVAFGSNTSRPHHAPTTKKLSKNTLVLIDLGVKYKGTTSDITRMFVFGKPQKKWVETYKKCFKALKEVEKKAQEGEKASVLWNTAEKEVGKMPHALGHGIGAEEHDYPGAISPKTSWKLKKGMCLAIEPAIYKKSFGIRLEDDFVVGKKGLKPLTRAPKLIYSTKN